jgi:hypothetical protein
MNIFNYHFKLVNTTNLVRIGSNFYDNTMEDLKLETSILICGKIIINNLSGLEKVNISLLGMLVLVSTT